MYRSGTGLGAVVWAVLAIPFVVVGLATSGLLSKIALGLAALLGLLMVVNLAYFATGRGRGGWTVDSPDRTADG